MALLPWTIALLCIAACGTESSPQGIYLRNPELTEWTNGLFTAPDGWTLGGTGTGAVRPGSAIRGGPLFSARISARRADWALYQDLEDVALSAGGDFVFAAWVRARRPRVAQLTVNAGNVVFSSPWHSGSGEWERLEVRGTIPEDATTLRVHAWARDGGETEAGGFTLRVDPPAPKPLSNLDFASWSSGEAAPPDGWHLAGSAVVRRGAPGAPGAAFSALVFASGGDVALFQDVLPQPLAGRQLRYQAWVRTSNPESVQVAIGDGVGWFKSNWHPGNGKWQLLGTTATIAPGARSARVYVRSRNGASFEVGGGTQWVDPRPRHSNRQLYLLALAILVCVALVLPSTRGWLVEAARTGAPPQLLSALRPALTPERFVVVAGTAFGLAFALSTPPLQAPDEPAHFFRAFAVSDGQILPVVHDEGGHKVVGAIVPKSFVRMETAVGFWDLPFHSDRKFDTGSIRRELARPLNADDRQFDNPGAPIMYAPVTYLPQALAIAIGRVARPSPLALLYLARFGNLFCWILIMGLAVRVTPVFKWGFALLALSPMSVFLAGSTSADAVTNCFSFLVVALFLEAAFRDAAPVSGARLARLCAASVLLALCKQVYLTLSLLLLLVPARKLGGPRRRTAIFAAILGLQIAASALWTWLAIAGHPPLRAGANPAAQLSLALHHPLWMIGVFLRTHKAYTPMYLASFVGDLGWLDIPLPAWIVVSYLLVAVLVAVLYGVPRGLLRPRHRALLLASAFAGWTLILGFQYLTWTPLGENLIDGGIGRYLIPLAPAALLAIASGRIAPDAEPVKLRLAGFLTLVLCVALVYTIVRYYVP